TTEGTEFHGGIAQRDSDVRRVRLSVDALICLRIGGCKILAGISIRDAERNCACRGVFGWRICHCDYAAGPELESSIGARGTSRNSTCRAVAGVCRFSDQLRIYWDHVGKPSPAVQSHPALGQLAAIFESVASSGSNVCPISYCALGSPL